MASAGDDWLPPDYAAKTTLGVGAMMNSIIDAASRLKNKFDATTENDFWFLWEVLNNEAETGLYQCYHASKEYLESGFSSIKVGGNATYIFGGLYVLAVFWLLFGSVISSLQTETKCSRNGNLFYSKC
jgi:hypothetical protein